MNKKTVFISLAGLLGIIFIMFFSLKIFQIVYFNEKYYKVPNLKSYTVKEVTEALKNSELSIKEAGEEFSDLPIGEIFLQEPEANSVVKKGRTIKVWVSKGKALKVSCCWRPEHFRRKETQGRSIKLLKRNRF